MDTDQLGNVHIWFLETRCRDCDAIVSFNDHTDSIDSKSMVSTQEERKPYISFSHHINKKENKK
jgi:hypothetical protein